VWPPFTQSGSRAKKTHGVHQHGQGAMTGVSVVLAFLAAMSNAGSSVLQRQAYLDQPSNAVLSLRLLWHFVRCPPWLGGIGAVTVSFLLPPVGCAGPQRARQRRYVDGPPAGAGTLAVAVGALLSGRSSVLVGIKSDGDTVGELELPASDLYAQGGPGRTLLTPISTHRPLGLLRMHRRCAASIGASRARVPVPQAAVPIRSIRTETRPARGQRSADEQDGNARGRGGAGPP
jgi:hypothetical protein